MDEEIELVSDGQGLIVTGPEGAVERFLAWSGLKKFVTDVGTETPAALFDAGSTLAQAASAIEDGSSRYLKLTKESAELVKDRGLMPTKVRGISHAMLGEPGDINKWIQVEDQANSLFSNPAVLTGVAGLMSQIARQVEAQENKELLQRIDVKLDDALRHQRDEVLSQLDRAVDCVAEAMTIRAHGGHMDTAWDKVASESGTIKHVRNMALRKLEALADKLQNPEKVRKVARAMADVERETALWLTVLARTLQLEDEYTIIELDHVMRTEPEKLERHRQALTANLDDRRHQVLDRSRRLISRMEAASGFASSNVVLHARASSRIVDSASRVGETIADFHRPIGLDIVLTPQPKPTWFAAVRDPQQLGAAVKEVGPAIGIAALVPVALALHALSHKDGDNHEA